MTTTDPDPTRSPPAPLRRRGDDRLLTGLCAGLARHAGLPPSAVRLVALVALVVVPWLTVLAYTGLSLVVRRDDERALLGGASGPHDGRETVVGWLLLLACVPILGGVSGTLGAGLRAPVDLYERFLGDAEGLLGGSAPGVYLGAGGLLVAGLLALGFLALVVSVLVAGGDRERGREPGAAPADAPTRVLPASALARTARPRKPGPSLLLLGSAAALGLACLLGLAAATGILDPGATAVAVLLGLAALGCVGAALLWRERRHAGGLVALAALLAAAGWGVGALAPVLDAGVGARVYAPVTVAQVPPVYRLGVGRLTVDLRQLALERGDRVTVSARLDAGRIRILAPRDVRVNTLGPSGVSVVSGTGRPLSPRADGPRAPRIGISTDVGAGSAQVVVP